MDGQGNSERTWKVREKSGNLKINSYGGQSLENLFILFRRGKDYFSGVSRNQSPSSLGATLKGKNLLPWGASSLL